MDIEELKHYRYISVVYIRLIAKLIDCEGERLTPFLKGTNLTVQKIYSDLQFISLDDQYIIFNNFLDKAPAAGLGIEAGTHAGLSIHGLPGVTILASSTLLEGLRNLVKFYALRAPFINIDLIESSDSLVLKGKCIDPVNTQVNRFLLECAFSMIHNICEQMTGRDLSCAAIQFSYDKPEDTTLYNKHLKCNVSFEQQEYCTYTLPFEIGKTASLTADPHLKQHAIDSCTAEKDKLLQSSSTTSQVRRLLTLKDGEFQSLKEIADHLCISSRQLTRQLSNEGTSYRDLLNNEQQRLSLRFLEDDNISIEAIASLLGYTQVSNYRRAFKKWYGVTPSDYRQQLKDINGGR